MKRKLCIAITLLMLLSMAFAFPTLAQPAPEYVVDQAELLTPAQEQELQKLVDEIKQEYQFEVVILTVDSIGNKSAQDYADDFYDQGAYGPDGLLFLLSMEYRDYWASTAGEGIKWFSDYRLDSMADQILSNLSNGQYFQAFKQYITLVETQLEQSNADDYVPGGSENSVSKRSLQDNLIVIGVILVVAFVVAFCIVSGMKKKMSTKNRKVDAKYYIGANNLQLSRQQDIFMYSRLARVARAQDTSSSSSGRSGGGGSSHRSSGGVSHGGRGGKF